MADFVRFISGFDRCEPPVCSVDITIDVMNISCIQDAVYVQWSIVDNTGTGLLDDLNLNEVIWSCDEGSDITTVPISSDPYEAQLNRSDCDGVINLRVRIRIGATFFLSSSHVFDTDNCTTDVVSENMVQATLSNCTPVQEMPSYNLYALQDIIPPRPVYFEYDGFCWEIDEFAYDNAIPADNDAGVVLDSIDIIHTSPDFCCQKNLCPSDWYFDPLYGELVAWYYIEWNTYWIPDRIMVFGNWPDDCLDPTNILWDSGCAANWLDLVATRSGGFSRKSIDCDGDKCADLRLAVPATPDPCVWCEDGTEGPGINIGWADTICLDYEEYHHDYLGVENFRCKADCFLVKQSDLPLGVSTWGRCNPDDGGTPWCSCIIGPSGAVVSHLCNNDNVCEKPDEEVYCVRQLSTDSCGCTTTLPDPANTNKEVLGTYFSLAECQDGCICPGSSSSSVSSSSSSLSSSSDSSASSSSSSVSSSSSSSISSSSSSDTPTSSSSSVSSSSSSSVSSSSSSLSSSSSSSSSLSSSSSSSISSSSSSSVSSSSSSDGGYMGSSFIPWREEGELEEAVDQFYIDNPGIFYDKTDEEIENIILELVANGDMLADIAIEIATREGLDLE